MKKEKKVPNYLKNKYLIKLYQSKFGIIITNWLNQGMSYMLIEEIIIKSLYGIFFFIIFYFSLVGIELNCRVFFSILLSHTTNWLINGHFYNLIRYLGLGKKDLRWFVTYPEKIRNRLITKNSISSIALYGSFSRKKYSKYSDLDVRVVSRKNILNSLIVAFYVSIERFIAFLNQYPIDIYMITQDRGLEKLRDDEYPVILFDKDNFMKNNYKEYSFFSEIID